MSNINIWSTEYNPFQKWKVLAWYERMLRIKTGNFDAPVNIALDLVQGTPLKKACGKFKCNFCMSDLEDQCKSAKIPREVLLKIPQFYNEWGVRSICLAGHNSDPTMYNHADLITFLRLCNKWNVEVGFVSNGAYFTDELIEEVARTCNWSGWSLNAGTKESHSKITNSPFGTYDKILENMKKMSEYVKKHKLDHDIGYKYLITDDNYTDILEGVRNGKNAGARHFQIRPAELSLDRIKKIDVNEVEDQIKASLKLEVAGEFEVFGIREKFNPNFTKRKIKRCIASPLGSTWKADGDIVICPDRRWSAHLPNMTLGNFIVEGLEGIRRKWGGTEHLAMIKTVNEDLEHCIRCTSCHWHELYEMCVEVDSLDITLI